MRELEKLFESLESQDVKRSAEANEALLRKIELGHELGDIIKYYLYNRSERALNLLIQIKEPNDKALLDAIDEILRFKYSMAENLIILLCQITNQALDWVPKIPDHTVFTTLLGIIEAFSKKDNERITTCISGSMFLCQLLPQCGAFKPITLQKLCKTFMKLCQLIHRKKQEVPDNFDLSKTPASIEVDVTHSGHLAFSLRELFQTIYGIYPQNFIHYLRNYLLRAQDERTEVFLSVIKPLMLGVRLHPNLVTMNIDGELSRERWIKREPHDFMNDGLEVGIGTIPPLVVPSKLKQVESDILEEEGWLSMMGNNLEGEECYGLSEDGKTWHDLAVVSETLITDTLNEIQAFDGPLIRNDNRLIITPPTYHRHPNRNLRSSVSESFRVIKRLFNTGGLSSIESEDQLLTLALNGGSISSAEEAEDFEKSKRVRSLKRVTISAPEDELNIDSVEREEDIPVLQLLQRTMSYDNVGCSSKCVSKEKPPVVKSLMKPQAMSSSDMSRSSKPAPPEPRKETIILEMDGPPDAGKDETENPDSTDPPKEKADPTDPPIENPDSTEPPKENPDPTDPPKENPDPTEAPKEYHVVKKKNKSKTEDNLSDQEEEDSDANSDGSMLGSDGDLVSVLMHSLAELDETMESLLGPKLPFGAIEDEIIRDVDYFNDEKTERLIKYKRFEQTKILEDSKGRKIKISSKNKKKNIENRQNIGTSLSFRSPSIASSIDSTEDSTSYTYLNDSRDSVDLREKYPYLSSIFDDDYDKVYMEYGKKLEEINNFRRISYIQKSKEFHTCLTLLGLSDRLPGRIFDDMSHITAGLSMEKQRDLLRARLNLVNHHLLYERSCRLLHATRNRRLFARLKQQMTRQTEMNNLRTTNYYLNQEKNEVMRSKIMMMQKHRERESDFNLKAEAWKNALESAETEIRELRQSVAEYETKYEIYRSYAEQQLVDTLECKQQLSQKSEELKDALKKVDKHENFTLPKNLSLQKSNDFYRSELKKYRKQELDFDRKGKKEFEKLKRSFGEEKEIVKTQDVTIEALRIQVKQLEKLLTEEEDKTRKHGEKVKMFEQKRGEEINYAKDMLGTLERTVKRSHLETKELYRLIENMKRDREPKENQSKKQLVYDDIFRHGGFAQRYIDFLPPEEKLAFYLPSHAEKMHEEYRSESNNEPEKLPESTDSETVVASDTTVQESGQKSEPSSAAPSEKPTCSKELPAQL